MFEVIAEPKRRAILSLLVSSEQSVGEMERQLRMPQPATIAITFDNWYFRRFIENRQYTRCGLAVQVEHYPAVSQGDR